MTIPSSFNPDINQIINFDLKKEFYLNKLKNIYIKSLPSENVDSLVENLREKNKNNNNNNDNHNSNEIIIKMDELIEESLNLNPNNDEFKNEIYKFKKKFDENIKNKIIDIKKFFLFVIESKIFIQKLKIFDEFKKLDVKNRGYLNYKDCIPLFNNNYIKNLPEPFENEKIDFGKFFKYYIEYKHIYMPSSVVCY